MDTAGPRTVFGFELQTPFPLRTARYGPGTPLQVDLSDSPPANGGRVLMRWSTERGDPIEATLTDDGHGGYVLDVADSGRYVVRPEDALIEIPSDTPEILREVRLLGFPLLLSFLKRGDLSVHAAAVESPAGALLLAAPGRHGKTSLAAAFAKRGNRLLTEDLCCLRPGPPTELIPGPATLRVREDMQSILPVPDMTELGRLDDRLVLASTSPGTCDPVPVAGIVLLKDFGAELMVDRAAPAAALPDLWLLSLHLPTEADRARKFTQLADLTAEVPVWNVIQPTGVTAAPATANTLIGLIEA